MLYSGNLDMFTVSIFGSNVEMFKTDEVASKDAAIDIVLEYIESMSWFSFALVKSPEGAEWIYFVRIETPLIDGRTKYLIKECRIGTHMERQFHHYAEN